MEIQDGLTAIKVLHGECDMWEQEMKKIQRAAQVARLEEDDDDVFWWQGKYLAAHKRYEAARSELRKKEIEKDLGG